MTGVDGGARSFPPPRPPREQAGPQPSVVAAAQVALNLLGRKWVVPIVVALSSRPRRHGELLRALGPRLHEKVLTETLRRMEAAGLITRRVVAEIPPSVLYSLTDLGRSLDEPIDRLAEWTWAHRQQLPDPASARTRQDGPAG